jgi:acyl-CoA thioester hydrolase
LKAPLSARGPFVYDVPVRFHDLDAMGHAHHSLPLIYIEEARAAFWRDVVGSGDLSAIDYVLKKATVEFHDRILFPSTLRITLRVTHVGRTSFTIGYDLHNQSGVLVATAETVQVMFDYASGRPKSIPESVRQILEASH